MRKCLKTIREIAVGFFIFIFLLKFSDYLHNSTSSRIISVLYNNVGLIGIVICVFEFLISCYDTIDTKLKEKMRLKYHMILVNIREQIKRSIKNKPNKFSCTTLGQLIVVFNNDDSISELVIQELRNRTNFTPKLESMVSYLFLKNEFNNHFAHFFMEHPEDKLLFETISHNISTDFVDCIYSGTNPIDKEFTITEILIALRHICLPHNYIETDKFVVVCRILLDFIREKLEMLDFENNASNISFFLTSIPLLQDKMSVAQIHNEQITEKLSEIMDSSWTDKAVKKAYRKIIASLRINSNFYDCEEISCCANLVSIYFDKLMPHQKWNLYLKIREFNNGVISAYHNYTEDKVILLLVCSSIFSKIRKQKDLINDALSLAYLGATGTKALHSQITEG